MTVDRPETGYSFNYVVGLQGVYVSQEKRARVVRTPEPVVTASTPFLSLDLPTLPWVFSVAASVVTCLWLWQARTRNTNARMAATATASGWAPPA